MVVVEQWAEQRRLHFVGGKSIKQLARETGLSRNTLPGALRRKEPPVYRRAPAGSVLDPFKEEIHPLLRGDSSLTGAGVRKLLAPLGCRAGKTVVDGYLREVRPLFAPAPRTFARAVRRPGQVCQFDVWQPRANVPVGHGQTPRLCRGRVSGLLARRRGRVGLIDSGRGPARRRRRLLGAAGRYGEATGGAGSLSRCAGEEARRRRHELESRLAPWRRSAPTIRSVWRR